jgi:hypothetical protein
MKHEYIGVVEFEAAGDWQVFEVYRQGSRLLFGSHCNCGFLQSGYMDMDVDNHWNDRGMLLDSELLELIADLECYYTDGPEYVSRIVCNDRM